jgi:uncharacterized protein YqeY
MSLLEKIDDDLKSAMKASDSLKVSVLRMAKASIKNREIDMRKELSDDDIIPVLSTLAKQRRESIDQFSKGGRQDLAEKESLELAILQSYLPEQITPEELDRIVLEAIKESSAAGAKDMGKVMRLVMPRTKGAADGKLVSQRVTELLEQI